MRKYLLLFIISISTPALSQKKMTLQECIDYAIQNNQNVKSAQASVDASEARVAEYIATGLPQISGNADLGNNYLIPTSFLPGDFFGKPGEYVGVQFGTQYTGRATIDLNQMIFSGSFFVGLKASKTYTELSRKDLISTEIDLVANVKKAYYSVLVYQERDALVQKNYKRLDSLLQQTKIMNENGFVEKIDVSRVQVQYNNISQAARNSAMAVDINIKLLKFQMGMPLTDPIELTENLETLQLNVLSDDHKTEFNYNNRIEYSKLQINKELVELDIKNTRVQYLPTLDFYGNYGASYGTSVFSNFVAFGENWRTLGAYGLRLSVPIFDGLRKNKMVQQKKSKLIQVELAQDLVRNQIDLEQDQLNQQFANNLRTLEAQKENMQLAEEVYTVANIKYQQGIGSNIEVIDADAAFKEAQTNYFSALYDALISTVDLDKAYGKLIITTNK